MIKNFQTTVYNANDNKVKALSFKRVVLQTSSEYVIWSTGIWGILSSILCETLTSEFGRLKVEKPQKSNTKLE